MSQNRNENTSFFRCSRCGETSSVNETICKRCGCSLLMYGEVITNEPAPPQQTSKPDNPTPSLPHPQPTPVYPTPLPNPPISLDENIKKQKHEIKMISLSIGMSIVVCFVISFLVPMLASSFTHYDDDPVVKYTVNDIIIPLFSMLIPFAIMALINRKRYVLPVVPKEVIKPDRCIMWVCFGMLCCVFAQYGINELASQIYNTFGITRIQDEMSYNNSIFIYITAIIPPICMELAMRCFSLQLLRKYGNGFAVFAVSIVFGMLFHDVIQFLFGFAVGLVLGLITIKTNSIVPAVIINIFNNYLLVIKITAYGLNDAVLNNFVYIISFIWLVAGVVSTIMLLVNGAFKKSFSVPKSTLKFRQKITSFFFPWMLLPLAMLILSTLLNFA